MRCEKTWAIANTWRIQIHLMLNCRIDLKASSISSSSPTPLSIAVWFNRHARYSTSWLSDIKIHPLKRSNGTTGFTSFISNFNLSCIQPGMENFMLELEIEIPLIYTLIWILSNKYDFHMKAFISHLIEYVFAN